MCIDNNNEWDEVFPIEKQNDHPFDSDHSSDTSMNIDSPSQNDHEHEQSSKDTHNRTANARAMSLQVKGDWHDLFLDEYLEHGRITTAAKAAGIARSAVHATLAANPAFSERFEEIKAQRKENIEAELYRRAMTTSDRLLEFLAKAEMPDKYRENSNINVNIGAEFVIDLGADDDDIQQAVVLPTPPEPPVLEN